MAMSAEHRSKLQPFIGNDDVSIMNEIFSSGTPNKQTNKQTNKHMDVFAEGFTINSNLKIGQEIQTNPLSVFIFEK